MQKETKERINVREASRGRGKEEGRDGVGESRECDDERLYEQTNNGTNDDDTRKEDEEEGKRHHEKQQEKKILTFIKHSPGAGITTIHTRTRGCGLGLVGFQGQEERDDSKMHGGREIGRMEQHQN